MAARQVTGGVTASLICVIAALLMAIILGVHAIVWPTVVIVLLMMHAATAWYAWGRIEQLQGQVDMKKIMLDARMQHEIPVHSEDTVKLSAACTIQLDRSATIKVYP